MAKRRRGNSHAERYLPVGMLCVTLLAAMVVLPTTLRPPAQQPNQTAELSPDAPPDDSSTAIISSLNRASSGVTTEDGAGEGEGDGGGPAVTPPPAPPTTLVARACPGGVGDPPRQTDSVYAAPCAAPFSGDNGGATWKGVTGTEIRISVQGWITHENNVEGALGTEPQAHESSADRTLRVIQNYLNKNFQFYGRQLRFYVADPNTYKNPDQRESDIRRAAQKAALTYNVFASSMTSNPACDEFARLQRVAMCFNSPDVEWYRKRAPYNYSFYMNSTEMMDFSAEFVCKQLVGRPAVHAGDEAMRSRTRKFGIFYYDAEGGGGSVSAFSMYWAHAAFYLRDLLRQQCGIDPVMIGYSSDGGTNQQAMATAIARYRANDVTTLLPMIDWASNSLFTNAAQAASYSPEWVITGAGNLERNVIGRLANQDQWSQAFGITPMEGTRPSHDTECWRAYQSMERSTSPEIDMCYYVWHTLLALANGIQMAGPNLTPTTFHEGLQKYGARRFDRPRWAISGSWGPNRYTYASNIAVVWYDRRAPEVEANGGTGAYKFVHGGQRWDRGQVPSEPLPVFREGTTSVLV